MSDNEIMMMPEWYIDLDILLLRRPETFFGLIRRKIFNKAIFEQGLVRFIENLSTEYNIHGIGFNFSDYQKGIIQDLVPLIDVYWYDTEYGKREKCKQQLIQLIDRRKNVEVFVTTEERSKWVRKGYNYLNLDTLIKCFSMGEMLLNGTEIFI